MRFKKVKILKVSACLLTGVLYYILVFRNSGKVTVEDPMITRELIELLQQKITNLQDAGMWLDMGKQRTCTQNEAVGDCQQSLPPNISPENIEGIRKPVSRIGMNRLQEIREVFNVKPEGKKYVLITGASSNHFNETQASIHSLHKNVLPHLTNYSFIFYDLGLSEKERQLVRDFSLAELRPFPFDKLPSRLGYLNCYLWKPLIIWAHLQTADYLLWFDASAYFVKDISSYFSTVAHTGILVNKEPHPMAQHTHLKLFSYFGDQACQFSSYTEIAAGFQVIHNEPFSRRLIIEPYVACALDPDCMCPEETKIMLMCPQNVRKYGKCHRFDQATLGYILIKLLGQHRPSVFIKDVCHQIRQDQKEDYLEEKKRAVHLK